MGVILDRAAVLAYRVRVQQLDRARGTIANTAVLNLGVQDTGADGSLWALAVRGVDVTKVAERDLCTVWTVRGAPHVYRRKDMPGVAAAVEPFSDADAGKRIYNASKPLNAAGIGNIEALDAVAVAMRSIVTKPTAKGDVSTRLTKRMDEPYRRSCRACDAIHLYEMPFRLAALRAGLELQPGTSPPVLERIPGFRKAAKVPAAFEVVRAYLHLLGPATPKLVAEYLDAPVKDVASRWPEDVVEVEVEGERRSILAADEDALLGDWPNVSRLLAPFDLFLQARDRALLVPHAKRSKALWPVLGRPGGVLHDRDIVGLWRARKTGAKTAVEVTLWTKETPALRTAIDEQAERLAAFRRTELQKLTVAAA